ncbi:MAG: MerR family transcriptional regulator [Oscillospiraceae bacterium]|nr:MerR family transcriptional regulator [Oscillospiraceae bacterium]
MKPLTVSQISRLTGVSVRALHYYDQIGLLRPGCVTEAGYRLYGGEELKKLQQILFFRELDFSLKEIRTIMESPGYQSQTALAHQRDLLTLQKERLEKLIALIDRTIEGGTDMEFTEFDNTEIQKAKEQYAEEARQRWGDTEAWAESERRTAGYDKADWDQAAAEAETVYRSFLAAMPLGPESEQAQAAVKSWQDHITRRWYLCTDEILAGLGEMYVQDPRFTQNIDSRGAGLAQFMSDAIRLFCQRRGGPEENPKKD